MSRIYGFSKIGKVNFFSVKFYLDHVSCTKNWVQSIQFIEDKQTKSHLQSFDMPQNCLLKSLLSCLRFNRYCCKSDISFFEWRVTLEI